MKTAILVLSKNKFVSNENFSAEKCLSEFLYGKGIDIVLKLTVGFNENEIISGLDYATSGVDKVFILCDKQNYIGFKNIFIKFTLNDLCESQFGKSAIEEYAKAKGVNLTRKDIENYNLPRDSKAIKNTNSTYLGYIFKRKDIEYIVLPKDEREVKEMLKFSLSSFLETELKKHYLTESIWTFGISENDIIERLGVVTKNKSKIAISVADNGLNCEVVVRYRIDTSKTEVDATLLEVRQKLKDYIYSDLNMNIGAFAKELLTIRGKNISLIETVSNGAVLNEFLKSGADTEDFVDEAMVLKTAESMFENFGISEMFLQSKENGDISYELAAKLLEFNPTAVVISTYGSFITPNSLKAAIAVGDRENIMVFNQSLTGEYSEIMSNLSKYALFYLVKKLKQ